MSRVISWFSAGAASAVNTKLGIAKYGERLVIAYTDPGSEHADNPRFLADCERWFGRKVEHLRSKKYRDTWQVWEERRFIVSPKGALCTTELKKIPRYEFQQPDDIQLFGYTIEERDRVERFREQNPDVILEALLVEHGLTKADCLAIVERAGIELPMMYRLGFNNNNCVGCPKGGMGYWNKIRLHFPPVFTRMAKLQRDLGVYFFSEEDGTPIYLDELNPNRGSDKEPSIDCSLLCAIAEQKIEGINSRINTKKNEGAVNNTEKRIADKYAEKRI